LENGRKCRHGERTIAWKIAQNTVLQEVTGLLNEKNWLDIDENYILKVANRTLTFKMPVNIMKRFNCMIVKRTAKWDIIVKAKYTTFLNLLV